jgi:hypothetical protein
LLVVLAALAVAYSIAALIALTLLKRVL